MKFSLLAAAIVALALAGCGKPHQANPESIEGYGTRTEEGTTVAEERAAAGEVSETADPSSFDVQNAGQAAEHVDKSGSPVEATEGEATSAVDAAGGVTGAAVGAGVGAAAGGLTAPAKGITSALKCVDKTGLPILCTAAGAINTGASPVEGALEGTAKGAAIGSGN